MEAIQSPAELRWHEGPLPNVHKVPYDCRILAWFVHDFREEERQIWERDLRGFIVDPTRYQGKLARIEMVMPHQDDLNPLRWCDSSGHPVGLVERVQYWAWIRQGEPVVEAPWQEVGF